MSISSQTLTPTMSVSSQTLTPTRHTLINIEPKPGRITMKKFRKLRRRYRSRKTNFSVQACMTILVLIAGMWYYESDLKGLGVREKLLPDAVVGYFDFEGRAIDGGRRLDDVVDDVMPEWLELYESESYNSTLPDGTNTTFYRPLRDEYNCNITKISEKQLDCDARPNCITSAYNMYGEAREGRTYVDDPFTMEGLKKGGLLLHILIMFWMFMGLAIICDDYFESSLEKICESLNLKEDVAGATFMAAGGSAPELFTSVMGVFVSKSDIGFGTIVGSAVFNVLFVIAACAFMCPNLKVTWWPLARDCVSYCIGIIALVKFVMDSEVYAYEAGLLLLLYAGYVTIMYFNESLEKYVGGKLEESEKHMANLTGHREVLDKIVTSVPFDLIIYVAIFLNVACVIWPDIPNATTFNTICSYLFIFEAVFKFYIYTFFGYWLNPLNAFDGVLVVLILFELVIMSSGASMSGNLRTMRLFRFFRALRTLRIVKLYKLLYKEYSDASTQTEMGDNERSFKRLPIHKEGMQKEIAPTKVVPVDGGEGKTLEEREAELEAAQKQKEEEEGTEEKNDGDDDDDDEPVDIWDKGESPSDIALWAFGFPLALLMSLTIPDVKKEKFSGGYWFWVTFFMSIVWIAALAFMMVWMATVMGLVTGIPDPVMGLTILAAGTSVPDLLSSLAVAKRGHGDMAVSSSIGSNVFDILIGLPVPWLLATTAISTWEPVNDGGMAFVSINSGGLNIMVLTLFVMVGMVIATIKACDWVLTYKLACAMMALYAIFMMMSLGLEYCILMSCDCS